MASFSSPITAGRGRDYGALDLNNFTFQASPYTTRLAVAISVILVFFFFWQNKAPGGKQLSLPPGPKGLPLLGNLKDIVRESKKGQQHLLIDQWAKTYGEIFRVKVGPYTEYFVNSDRAVKELFDRSSAQTSQRPRWIISNELICNKLNVLLLDASEPRWKQQRRVIHSGLTSVPQADAGLPFLHFETAKFLNEVANDPSAGHSAARLWTSIGRYTYSTFASQIFGMEIPDSEDPVIAYIHETGLAQIEGTLPGSNIVDVLPVLDQLPLFMKPWERHARTRFKRDWEWCQERLERIKKQEPRGDSILRTAFLRMVLDDQKHLGFESVQEAAYVGLMVLLGAADTSRMSTWSLLEAMMMFPDVQKKAQHEIDRVVQDRLPVFSDIERIPYVKCIMKEVWRWRPPVALGHPHTCTRDLVYGDYLIPKGSRLHLNAWSIGHDPVRHENPNTFRPERYIHDQTTTMQSINSSDPSKRDHFAFGAGRRVCPGYHVADRSLAVSIMRILWAFNISPSPGTKLPLDPATYPSFIPGNPGTDLPVTLTIRSEEKKSIINHEYSKECKMRPEMESLA